METMHFNDEVVPSERVAGLEVKAKVDDRELKMATQLIGSLTTDFKPEKYKDEYREAVMAIIERKAAGEEIHHRADDREIGRRRTHAQPHGRAGAKPGEIAASCVARADDPAAEERVV